MELSNSTPVPAKLLLGRTVGARRAVVTSKASFRIGAGDPSLDQERTVEIFDDAEDYDDDFILPADVPACVILFGMGRRYPSRYCSTTTTAAVRPAARS